MRLGRLLLIGALLLLGAELAFAQGAGPFGVGRPESGFDVRAFGSLAPLIAWIAQTQAELYRAFAAAVRATRTDWIAGVTLMALAFGYGVLHAAGPGHGKAVISSYLLATRETLPRGVAVSMTAALAQAVTAILLVGTLAVLLNMTSVAIGRWTGFIEIVSYALVALLGALLLGRKLWSLWPTPSPASLSAAAPSMTADDPCCAAHAIAPERLSAPLDLKTAAAVLAVGLRPCTGAVLILIFALAQGVFWIGVLAVLAMALGTGLTVTALAIIAVGAKSLAVRLAARRSRLQIAIGHGIEILGAALLLVFGLILLSAALVQGAPGR